MDKKRSLSNKPVMAVGAGATVVLGASSLAKLLPASPFMKFVTFKALVSLKLFLTQVQKAMVIALAKIQVFAPGLATSGSNTSILKAATSAEKIRGSGPLCHSICLEDQFSTIRTALYEIMRKRRVRPISVLRWATFVGSIVTCADCLCMEMELNVMLNLCPYLLQFQFRVWDSIST